MGLIGGLLLLPITGPVRGFRLFLEQIRDEADAVLHDEGRAFAELIELSMRRSAGQLSDEEYAAQEAELLARLSSIREYRDELLDADRGDDDGAWLEGEQDVDDERLDAEREVQHDAAPDAGRELRHAAAADAGREVAGEER